MCRIRTGQTVAAIPSIAVAYNQYPPPNYGGYQQPRPTSGECVAGMVLGIIALVISFIPFVGLIGIVGLILSIIGMRKARAEGRAGYGMGVAGLVCSIISLVPTVIVIIFFVGAAASCVSFCN